MKTVTVIFTKTPLSQEVAESMRQYTFNTEMDIEVGQHFKAKRYRTPIQVTKILDKTFAFVNILDGTLSDEATHPKDVPLAILEKDETDTIAPGGINFSTVGS